MTVKYITVPFKRRHLEWLAADGSSEGMSVMSSDALKSMECKDSWTIVADGSPVACGGTIEQWHGRHIAWAFLSEDSGPHMRYITRKSREIVAAPKGRVEMTVRCDFAAGHRWAPLLGFSVETPMLAMYGPEGEDHTGYVRFN